MNTMPEENTVNSNPKPLTESVLRRLTGEALLTFLGEAERFEAMAGPGLQLVLSNEPIADMNMLVAGAGADLQSFRRMAKFCLDRQLPFLAMIFPEAGDALDRIAEKIGLVYAVDFPLMVRDDLPLEPSGHPGVEVFRGSSHEDASGSAGVLVSAYSMPLDSVMRALPPTLFHSPGIDFYVARLGDETVGSVTITYHGDTCGIWAMGTNAGQQRGGIGKRLLSTAMAKARDGGYRRFFLGSTPAGYRLYESLNFKTICSARVWVSGTTHQA
jgi:hypothetical protein